MSIEAKLEEAVVTLIDKTINGVDSAVDFLSEEVPAYIEQLLTWYMVQGLIWMVFGLIIFTVSMYTCKKLLKHRKEYVHLERDDQRLEANQEWWYKAYDGDINPSWKTVIYGVLACVGVVVGFIMFCEHLLEPIQIMVAPHVWLVEYAADLKNKLG